MFRLFFLVRLLLCKQESSQTCQNKHEKCSDWKIAVLLFLFMGVNVQAQFGGGPSPVKVAKVQEVMLAPVRKVPANVQAKFISIIKAEFRGVVNYLVDVGSFIKQGDVLAELSDTQSKLREQELNNAVKSANARFNFLKSENSRLEDLVAKNLISNSELEQNQSDYLVAKSDLAQAKSRHNQYKDQVTKLTVKAPFSGHITQHFAQPGQLLDSGDNIVEFMQAGMLEVVVNVPYKYKSQISQNAKWDIQTTDSKLLSASINKFIPAATGQSHTIEVHLSVSDENLWPGEAVNVLVPIQIKQKVIAVPRDALVIRKDGTYVYIIKDNQAHKVDVVTGVAQGDYIAVTGSLTSGDLVVIRGNERLQPQTEVKIIE